MGSWVQGLEKAKKDSMDLDEIPPLQASTHDPVRHRDCSQSSAGAFVTGDDVDSLPVMKIG